MLNFLFPKEFKDLDSETFRAKLKSTRQARLIDVSSEEEFAELHLPGSQNIDVLGGDFQERIEKLSKNSPYFIYSTNGIRSQTAVIILKELGFKYVYHLVSGLHLWKGALERSY